MARLLIVSRSLALGMRLTDLHDVEEHSADELEQGLPDVEGFEVLVLDVGDPVLAVNTVNSLREDDQAIPVMLISGYQPEWEQVEAQQVEGVHVVPLPITRQALVRGVAVLLDEDPESITVEPTGAMPVVASASVTSVADAGATEDDDPDATVKTPLPAVVVAEPSTEDDEKPAKAQPSAGSAAGSGSVAAEPAAASPGPADVAAAKAVQQAAVQAKVRKAAEQVAKSAKKKPASSSASASVAKTGQSRPSPRKPDGQQTSAGQPAASKPEARRPAAQQPAAQEPGAGKTAAPTPGPAAQKPVQLATGAQAPGPQQPPLGPATGRLGQQIAARRAGQGPQHDRARRPGPPATQAIEVTSSQVAGLSYSSPVARPFSEQPPTGQFPLSNRAVQGGPPAPPAPPARPVSRWQRGNIAPETGSISLESSNIAANRRSQRLGDRPRKLQRRANPADATPGTPGRGLVTDPLGPRTDPYGLPMASALERRLDAEASALITPPGALDGQLDGRAVLRTADLIRALYERSGELYGVSDTSQILADDLVERSGSEAAAVLVPDGEIWRVSGGVGLRPAERRLELPDSHWLVAEIGSGRAVLIDDTDIVRQQLAGAPLAAWHHLLAVPVPDVRVIVVLARDEDGGAFTEADLSTVYPAVRESSVLLAQAIETRRLARALAPLREPEPER
ncbi:hypothetical protein KIH74_18985 [Kineosporia sp. J2-2]|uniref:GAF domain-containing protein n=1 Tax=Kineosporia corallincola TaxID=2835133 RepID=A0ABS5TIV3_9ACTN|nr:hypothetical protein [Kineosporia corallincola]MBT0771032.1 hypothetical protein [Kineosporia corallincola]